MTESAGPLSIAIPRNVVRVFSSRPQSPHKTVCLSHVSVCLSICVDWLIDLTAAAMFYLFIEENTEKHGDENPPLVPSLCDISVVFPLLVKISPITPHDGQ